jgi:hypothetical protein
VEKIYSFPMGEDLSKYLVSSRIHFAIVTVKNVKGHRYTVPLHFVKLSCLLQGHFCAL